MEAITKEKLESGKSTDGNQGKGLGVAMLLFGSRNPRSRAGRIVPPVINALRDVVSTLLR
jgi:hypothetical protein